MNELSKTKSLCPECLKTLDATIFEENNKVFIKKNCPEHGEVVEVYWEDYDMYNRAQKWAHDGKGITNPNVDKKEACPNNCGLCSEHKSHTCLGNIVVTNRCDLSCWYCLPKNEEIVVKNGGKISVAKIGELTEINILKNSEKIGNFGEFTQPKNMQIMTMKNKKIKWTNVTKMFKRKYKGKFIKIRTESGKEIVTTKNHKFVVRSDKGVLKKNIEIGDTLFSTLGLCSGNGFKIDLLESFRTLPKEEIKSLYVRNISEYFSSLDSSISDFSKNFGFRRASMYLWKNRDSMPLDSFYEFMNHGKIKPNGVTFGVDAKTYNFNRFLEITPALTKIIGYFVSDGHYSKQNIWFTCADEYVQNDIKTCLNELGLSYSTIKSKNKADQINVGNKILALIFRYVLDIPPGAHNKRLPTDFASFDEESRLSMLEGIMNGDGYVVRGDRHASIGVGSVSKGLVVDISRLLSTLNIKTRHHRMSMINNPLANAEILHKIYISGEDISFLTNKITLKPSHLKRLENLSPRRGTKLITEGDFILDKVKSIEEFDDKEQFVYDIEVEDGSHSFIAGDGILISNCFFFAQKMGYVYEPTLDQIRMMLRKMRQEKPVGSKAIQLTGGNPEVREDLIDIIKIAKEEGYDHVQPNINGTHKLWRDPQFAKDMRSAGSNTIYLSFDGTTPKTNPKNHWEIPSIIKNCKDANLSIVLVPTVIKGFNDGDLGNIIRFGIKNIDIVRAINFQPVSLVGRMPRNEREKSRITIPGAIKKIEEQTNSMIVRDDWYPVPIVTGVTRIVEAMKGIKKYQLSPHFACGMSTFIYKDRDEIIPLPRFIDIDGLMTYLNEKADEIESGQNKLFTAAKIVAKIGTFIDKEKQPKDLDMFNIFKDIIINKGNYRSLGNLMHKVQMLGMMHFQDLYNYDIERTKRCVVHYAQPDGTIVPFCAFNVIPELYRDKVQRKFSMTIPEWEAKNGKKLIDSLYKRDVAKLASTELYKKAYEGFI